MSFYPSREDLEEYESYVDCELDGNPVVAVWEQVSRAYYGAVIGLWIGPLYFDAGNFSPVAVRQIEAQCRDAVELAA